MYVSLNWLKEFVELSKNQTPESLANLLTLKTAEVESITDEAKSLDNMVTGLVLEIQKHPNADKLKLAKVSLGKETLQVVCGGANLKEGMYIAFAKVGSKVRWHGEGDLITLEKAVIRGIESSGMIVAASEIGLSELQKGPQDILDLSATKPRPGTPIAEIFKKNDVILEFDNKSLTHRPDLWGHYGIAREIAAITNSKFKPLKPNVKIPTKGESVKVTVEDHALCPRYCGLIINNIKVTESPDWLKARLRSTKHGTHNNVVDVTNYVMAELGQPMHAFDKNYIKKGIIVRHARHNEKITTLDNKQRTLNEDVLVIADHEKPVAIAGVMGGENSGINEKTTSIILEAATFNSSSIRRTSTKLNLRTEAVQRFEKALDPLLAELSIKRAAELILKICPGAKIAGPITDVKEFSNKPLKVKLDIEKANSKIGIKLSAKEIKEILESLEFKVAGEKTAGKILTVEIPSFRATKDVNIEDDLIEEISRIYGYDKIPATLPTLPTKLPMENTERFKKHRAREILSYGLGLDEVYNYSFYGTKEINDCLLQETGHLKLLNYLSQDQSHLRISLVPNLLKNLQENIKNFDEVKIYEIGRTYKDVDKYYPLEEKKITGAILIKEKSSKPFYEAKGIAEEILAKFNVPNTKITKEVAKPYAHPTKAISYLDQNAQTLAEVFMLHPTVSKNHDLQNYSIAFFDINFTQLVKIGATTTDRTYQKIARFPSIKIDVSVLVDKTIEIAKIAEAIKSADRELISETELFDIYEGQGIEPNKKAPAFRITLQASDRTLTDEEMAKVQTKIFINLEKLGGKIRGK